MPVNQKTPTLRKAARTVDGFLLPILSNQDEMYHPASFIRDTPEKMKSFGFTVEIPFTGSLDDGVACQVSHYAYTEGRITLRVTFICYREHLMAYRNWVASDPEIDLSAFKADN